ncbi:MAG: aconitate hydratase, partial [ANME-2 cluster archaeon]|nr:aconitate hydratase [ANME-2 cluster archaeon]
SMSMNITHKIISSHLVEGEMVAGEEIAITIDQTLTQDATGTMAYLQFEALDIPRVKVPLAVSYVDHNMLQAGFENADDHRFLQTFAYKYGIQYSKPGNGICHQVNLERFSKPGNTMIGSDSHTPTGGGAGMLAIGVGGLDVAVVMGGAPYYVKMPEVVGVKLIGKLNPWVSAKDVILEMLRRLTVKGGVGKIFEYYGPGVDTLSVPERATITNMGAELGATSSLFPSDDITRQFFEMQGRPDDWKTLTADVDAEYDGHIEINLSELEPMLAKPGSPDAVVQVSEVEGTPVQQVIIGSCTNSSYKDLMTVAEALKGKKVNPDLSFHITPGSRQVLETIIRNGALADMVSAGARIMETTCDGCIGLGSSPPTNSVSIRSFNRNWAGRSGTMDDSVYLASPEVCVAAALTGKITDPRELGAYPEVVWPDTFVADDSMVISPSDDPGSVEVIRGPNIKPLPKTKPLPIDLEGKLLIKLGDGISTDGIMPAGPKILPLRSNIPAISEFVFSQIDPDFPARAKENQGGFIVGGENYGQGSSREHAALAPMYLGVKGVITKSFARIHKANLVNFGILPLEFADSAGYDAVEQGDVIRFIGVRELIKEGATTIPIQVGSNTFECILDISNRQREIILAGGLLNYTKMVHG